MYLSVSRFRYTDEGYLTEVLDLFQKLHNAQILILEKGIVEVYKYQFSWLMIIISAVSNLNIASSLHFSLFLSHHTLSSLIDTMMLLGMRFMW